MRSPSRIIVSIENKFNDQTESGIYIDTSFKPEQHVVITGKVEAVAQRVPKDFRADGFYDTVEVGDKLYFHYLVLLDEDNKIQLEKDYYLVDYFQALATVRNGKVYAVGEHILIEPIEEELTNDTLIIPDSVKKQQTNRGRVFASNDPEIPEGSIVEFEPIGKFENEIEGKIVYVMYNSNILALHEKK
jgi:co-chaperonin GroES (HSP10)